MKLGEDQGQESPVDLLALLCQSLAIMDIGVIESRIRNELAPTNLDCANPETLHGLGPQAVPVLISLFKSPHTPYGAYSQAVIAATLTLFARCGDEAAKSFLREIAGGKVALLQGREGDAAFQVASTQVHMMGSEPQCGAESDDSKSQEESPSSETVGTAVLDADGKPITKSSVRPEDLHRVIEYLFDKARASLWQGEAGARERVSVFSLIFDLIPEGNSRYNLCGFYTNRGMAFKKLGQLSKALTDYRTALGLAEKQGDWTGADKCRRLIREASG